MATKTGAVRPASGLLKAWARVDQTSGVATGLTTKFNLGWEINAKIGIRIMSVDYYMSLDILNDIKHAFVADGDMMQWGLFVKSAVNTSEGESPNNIGMLDFNQLTLRVTGASAPTIFHDEPYKTKSLLDINGQGILCHPAALYAWSYVGNALSSGLYWGAMISYVEESLGTEQYQELVNGLLIQSA